jgi:hypothetical protein
MRVQPVDDRSLERSLVVEGGLVDVDPRCAQTLQDRADVLVLVFDKSSAAFGQALQCPIPLCLAERLPRELQRQHAEVVGDDRRVLLIWPFPSCHA